MSKLEKIADELSTLSILESAELAKMLEDKWGVSAAAPVAVAAAATTTEVKEEKTEFDIILSAIPEKKIDAIKIVREVTGLGLKEAKDMVDGAPGVIKAGMSKDEAEKLKKRFEEIGAKIEVK